MFEGDETMVMVVLVVVAVVVVGFCQTHLVVVDHGG